MQEIGLFACVRKILKEIGKVQSGVSTVKQKSKTLVT